MEGENEQKNIFTDGLRLTTSNQRIIPSFTHTGIKCMYIFIMQNSRMTYVRTCIFCTVGINFLDTVSLSFTNNHSHRKNFHPSS